jgi:hypothetical protein
LCDFLDKQDTCRLGQPGKLSSFAAKKAHIFALMERTTPEAAWIKERWSKVKALSVCLIRYAIVSSLVDLILPVG